MPLRSPSTPIPTILRRKVDIDALLPISIAFARAGSRYIEGLTAFRRDDLDAWLSLFATASGSACGTTIGLGQRVAALRKAWEARLVECRAPDSKSTPRHSAHGHQPAARPLDPLTKRSTCCA